MSHRDSISKHSGGTMRRYSTTELLTPLAPPLQPARSASYRPHESITNNNVGSHNKHRKSTLGGGRRQSKIFDDASVVRGYESVPLIEIDALPRGGISMETKAVGRIQVRLGSKTSCVFPEYGLILVGRWFRFDIFLIPSRFAFSYFATIVWNSSRDHQR